MDIIDILEITKGRLINNFDLRGTIKGFKINSKEVENGDCYIALTLQKDGHNYIKEAIKNGASLIIVSRALSFPIPTILVQDTIKALGDLARAIRKIYNPKVIAITGSVGKTTTRELIYTVLSTKYKCHQNKKNFNNQIGVPLTMFDLDKDDEVAIIEMGMNHFGEIKKLSDMIKPDIAVITSIGSSHIGNLGSRENILKAKLEIKSGLQGPLFVNGDDVLLKNQEAYKSGFSEDNDLVAHKVSSSLTSSTFTIDLNQTYQIKVGLQEFLLNDVLLAIQIGLYLNVDIQDMIKALGDYKPFNMRMNILNDNSGNTIINDCYNSSLESLSGVLRILKEEEADKLLIIGDINELGDFEEEIHEAIPPLLDKISNKKVIFVGEKITKLNYDALKFENYEQVIAYLKKEEIKDTLILIKASRSLKLENITNYLMNN